MKAEERIGKKFNYLTILDVIRIKKPRADRGAGLHYQVYFKCRCVCGKEKLIYGANVIDGGVKSCGCKRTELILSAIKKSYDKRDDGLMVERSFYSDCKNNAKKHHKEWTLTLEYFSELVNQGCFYCGCEPYSLKGNKNWTRKKKLNGIDRINSMYGYIHGNCVPCCINCNKAKNTMTLYQFEQWVKKIFSHRFWDRQN